MALPIDNSPADHRLLDVRPIAAAMGAEVDGVDLSDLDDDRFAEIQQALYRHGLLVFKGQDLAHADQEALTLRFGEHGVDAFTDGVDGFPNIQPVIREPGPPRPIFFGANWHTDSPFLERPPSISMLRSIEVPPWGGDTVYASSRQAYAALSDGMKALLAPLEGLFSRTHLTRAREQWADDETRPFDIAPVEHDLIGAVRHPIVRTHPVTGRRACTSTRTTPSASTVSDGRKRCRSCATSSPTSPRPSSRAVSDGSRRCSPCGTTASWCTKRSTTMPRTGGSCTARRSSARYRRDEAPDPLDAGGR